MICPGCGKVMIIVEYNKIEMDNCQACGGVWLDAGELELLLAGRERRDQFFASFNSVSKPKEKKRKCPRCRRAMAKVAFGREMPVVFDRCGKEHGLFLDQGELGALLKTAGVGTDEPVFTFVQTVFQG